MSGSCPTLKTLSKKSGKSPFFFFFLIHRASFWGTNHLVFEMVTLVSICMWFCHHLFSRSNPTTKELEASIWQENIPIFQTRISFLFNHSDHTPTSGLSVCETEFCISECLESKITNLQNPVMHVCVRETDHSPFSNYSGQGSVRMLNYNLPFFSLYC